MDLRSFGFSLMELMVVIAITALLLSLGGRFLPATMNRIESKQRISEIQLLLSKARSTALLTNSKVSLCPLDSQQRCTNQWNQELTLFTDPNHNRKLENNEKPIQTFPALTNTKAQRHFNNLAVGFDSQGFAGYNTGTFSFCFTGAARIGAKFVVSRNGRVRYTRTLSACSN